MKALCVLLALAAGMEFASAQALSAFPGAEGFGAAATGGRGGSVLYVTNLDPDPMGVLPGSLNFALRQAGPRYILFKVSGVIHGIANVVHGNVTIAGHSSPGGVIVRGMVCDGHYERNNCDNLIARHLRLRPGWNLPLPAGGERQDDGLRLDGIRNFMFDHLSIAHAADEAVQVSWASRGTIQRSIIAETIGDHADRGGMLLNYSHPEHPQDELSVIKNLWYRIGGRLPEFTCEASNYEGLPGSVSDCQAHPLRAEFSNNYYFDPGFLLYYNRDVNQNAALGPYRLQLNLVNNRMQVRPSFGYGYALRDILDVPDNQLFVDGNQLSRYPSFADYQLFYCCNDFPGAAPNTDFGVATRRTTRHEFAGVSYVNTASLQSNLLGDSGAYPMDPMDRRIRASVASGVIPEVSFELPLANDTFDLDFNPAAPPAPPADSDADGMPDAFELRHASLGLNPAVPDAGGSEISLPLLGVAGYPNLEVYLHLLALELQADRVFRHGFEF